MEPDGTIPIDPPAPPPTEPPRAGVIEPTPLHHDHYTYSGAFSAGWAAFKRRYGLMLGAICTYAAILFAIGFVVGFVDMFIQWGIVSALGVGLQLSPAQWVANVFIFGPLAAGLLWLGVHAVRDEAASFDELFGGFRNYKPVLIASGIPMVINIAVMLPATIAFGLSVGPTGAFNGPTAIAASIALIVGMIVSVYFNVRLLAAPVLVLDDRAPEFTGTDALRASWRLTEGRVLSLIGLAVTLYLLIAITMMLFCLPMFFLGAPLTVPVIAAAYSMLAHERGIAPVGEYTLCPMCGYDLSASTGACPECGNVPAPRSDHREAYARPGLM